MGGALFLFGMTSDHVECHSALAPIRPVPRASPKRGLSPSKHTSCLSGTICRTCDPKNEVDAALPLLPVFPLSFLEFPAHPSQLPRRSPCLTPSLLSPMRPSSSLMMALMLPYVLYPDLILEGRTSPSNTVMIRECMGENREMRK